MGGPYGPFSESRPEYESYGNARHLAFGITHLVMILCLIGRRGGRTLAKAAAAVWGPG
jgi:hypothetical protein